MNLRGKAPPRSPNKNISVDGIHINKQRRVGTGLAVAGRGRQPFAPVTNRQDGATSTGEAGSSEGLDEKLEFTKEEVEALLNEKIKSKKFDLKGKLEQMNDQIRRQKQCIKWFREVEERYNQEKEKLTNTLECAENKCKETEVTMKNKEEELNSLINELKVQVVSLQESLVKEEKEKQDTMKCHIQEKEARVAAEKLQATLREELAKAEDEKLCANQKVASMDDMYKRLQEYNTSLQQYNSKLQTDLATANESLKRVGSEKATIVENLSTLRSHYNALQDQLTSSRSAQEEAVHQKETLLKEVGRLRGELHQVREDRDRQVTQVQTLTAEVARWRESTGKSIAELDSLTIKLNALEETCSNQKEQIKVLQNQLMVANEKLMMSDMTSIEARTEFERQKRNVLELQERLTDAELQLLEAEKLRKKLHNTILELKGNIRVFCRVRPMLPDDGAEAEKAVVSYPTSLESEGRGVELLQNGKKVPFTFDKVFSHEASQQDVFVEISQLVQSALDGYKVCIFAYGQTGSGKTYTMMGMPEYPDQKGLIPRSLEQIFQTSQVLSAQGWKYKMQASILEIYNETIRDLLTSNRSNGVEISRAESGGFGKQYNISHDANGNTHVSDLTVIDVCSTREVSSLLHQAAQSRSVAKTKMNEHSSRSHFVFTLRITGFNESTKQQVQGVLNLIDLAGSERLKKSEATGETMKQTQAINKSLSCLNRVIQALPKKDGHVPFRDSKLTYLLQPCLGGDSKTLMFVNISPDPSSIEESIISLQFAANVNSCEIGVPRRQASIRSIDSRLSCG